MPKSYRFRTEIGVDREVRLNIEQDFDQLEILSLKLRQEDIYSRFCADYGVVAGRVVANGGFGIPNVSVSIFIPIDSIDENDPVISTLYPYRRPSDKNEDGYRYNLLPYVQENEGHTPTGTFPTRNDILTRKEVLEIYEKYYKYTVRTNQSGDFMIVGVPLGEQKLVMDLDLSNIGKFSLRPDDLVRMGLGVAEQFNGNKYKASENLDSLPQIINQVYDINVSSFWGEEDLCDVGITRVDMDLRDLGIEIEPRSIFMGSLFSSSEDDYIKGNCKPKNDVGKLCDAVTGFGRILAIRHGFGYDEDGLPILEEFNLEEEGYVVDDNGVWVTDLPMNLRYVVTNEFGEEVESSDQSIGVPTEAKYRFKIKWFVEDGLFNEIQRANYLVPNIRENGWSGWDTNDRPTQDDLNKSYAFSLDWNDYYDIPAAVKCEDTFYHFYYNKVYTVASHIDRFKFGNGRQKHYGIKEINDKKCHSEHNRFPTNDAQRNGNLLILLFNYILTLITPQVIVLIIIFHVLAVLWEVLKIFVNMIRFIVNFIYGVLCFAFVTITFGLAGVKYRDCLNPLIPKIEGNPFMNLGLPAMTYPDCDLCNCKLDGVDTTDNETVQNFLDSLDSFPISGALAPTSDSVMYDGLICDGSQSVDELEGQYEKLRLKTGLLGAGYDKRTKKYYEGIYKGENDEGQYWYKSPVYPIWDEGNGKIDNWYLNSNPTFSQTLNLINRRRTYFNQLGDATYDPFGMASTAIKIDYVNDQLGPSNSDSIYDKAIIFISKVPIPKGQLFTFNDPEKVNDWNRGLTGSTIHNESEYITIPINGIDPLGNVYTSNVQIYNPDSEYSEYKHTAGVEYFQCILSDSPRNINNRVNWGSDKRPSVIRDILVDYRLRYGCNDTEALNQNGAILDIPQYDKQIKDIIAGYPDTFFITIAVRGVDPRGRRQKIRYELSRLFGWGNPLNSNYTNYTSNEDGFTGQQVITGEFFMNVPIQPNNVLFNGNTPSPISGDDISGWYGDQNTPAPHYQYVGHDGGGEYRFSNANNNNVTTYDSNVRNPFNTSNLWNPTFLFQFDENTQWGTFWTQAPTKYVSLDKSLDHNDISNGNGNDPIDNSYFKSQDEDSDSKYRGIQTENLIRRYGHGTDNGNGLNATFGGGSYNLQYVQRNSEGCGYQYAQGQGSNELRIQSDKKAVITISSLYLNRDAELSDPFDEEQKQCRTYLPNKNNLVFRSDRLPAGDYWDETSEEELDNGDKDSIFYRRYAFHLNLSQTMFFIDDEGGSTSMGGNFEEFLPFDSSGESLDASEDGEDYGEEYSHTSDLISSFSCEGMVPFECYTGSGEEFEVLTGDDCVVNERFNMTARTRLVSGCYKFVTKKLILSIPEDIRHFLEYRVRLRFTFAVCQGIVGEMFQNNWINGVLYMPSFQKKTFYYTNPNDENFNQVERYKYCGDPKQPNDQLKHQGPLFFNTQSNSFFYRSTPYNNTTNKFSGQKPRRTRYYGQNERNIWFPTTICELGPKDSFIYEISFDPEFEGYIMDRMRSTTYGENSNILNLLIVSRLRNANFLELLLGLEDASIGQLFSRDDGGFLSRFFDARIDGDYAQLISIASELGVEPFLEGDYIDSNVYMDSDNIGIFFLSDTILRRKITNGAITYGLDPEGPDFIYGYDKSQEVPYYKWEINNNSPDVNVFGTEKNTWYTDEIFSSIYQGDDFFNNLPLTYMKPNYGYGKGYIYNRSLDDDTFNEFPGNNLSQNKFKVGGPFHFYFGLKRGKTAVTRFIRKYIELQ